MSFAQRLSTLIGEESIMKLKRSTRLKASNAHLYHFPIASENDL